MLDTAAAIRVFQQRDDIVKKAMFCWYGYMTPTSRTLAEATRSADRLATAYRDFADVLWAYQWPELARLGTTRLAQAYDEDFVQYKTLAETTSVGRYKAVAYWMDPGVSEEFEARADAIRGLGLPAEPTGLDPQVLVVPPTSVPAATATC